MQSTDSTPARLQRWHFPSPSSAPTHFICVPRGHYGRLCGYGEQTLAARHTVHALAPRTTGAFDLHQDVSGGGEGVRQVSCALLGLVVAVQGGEGLLRARALGVVLRLLVVEGGVHWDAGARGTGKERGGGAATKYDWGD
jgi:hypothetical protein